MSGIPLYAATHGPGDCHAFRLSVPGAQLAAEAAFRDLLAADVNARTVWGAPHRPVLSWRKVREDPARYTLWGTRRRTAPHQDEPQQPHATGWSVTELAVAGPGGSASYTHGGALRAYAARQGPSVHGGFVSWHTQLADAQAACVERVRARLRGDVREVSGYGAPDPQPGWWQQRFGADPERRWQLLPSAAELRARGWRSGDRCALLLRRIDVGDAPGSGEVWSACEWFVEYREIEP